MEGFLPATIMDGDGDKIDLGDERPHKRPRKRLQPEGILEKRIQVSKTITLL